MMSTPNRVLHIVNEFDHVGNGIVNVSCDLAYAQAKAGLKVAVASEDGSYVELLSAHGVSHYPVNLNDRSVRGIVRASVGILRAVSDFQPDIIHAHTMSAAILGRLGARSRRLVTTVHNEYQRSSSLMRLGHAVVGVSEAVSQSLIERGFPAKKVRTVYNGIVGSPRFNSEAQRFASMSSPSIVAVGMVSHRKGSDLLVEAFDAIGVDFPAVDLYFVGNCHWPELVSMVKSGTMSTRVHFEGFSSDPRSYMKPETILVLPSRQDPFPLVLLEAREMGVAIVGSDADGIPEALEFGEAGLLFKSGDAQGLADCLRQLLSDDELREQLASRTQRNLEPFSVDAMALAYQEVYTQVRKGMP